MWMMVLVIMINMTIDRVSVWASGAEYELVWQTNNEQEHAVWVVVMLVGVVRWGVACRGVMWCGVAAVVVAAAGVVVVIVVEVAVVVVVVVVVVVEMVGVEAVRAYPGHHTQSLKWFAVKKSRVWRSCPILLSRSRRRHWSNWSAQPVTYK
jgi:hypothetical protein